MNWRDGESSPIILQHFAVFFPAFDYDAALKIERKTSHLNIAFDRYASISTSIGDGVAQLIEAPG